MDNFPKELLDILNTPILKPEDGDYAEEEDGIVTFYRKDGHPFMHMPLDVYRQIRDDPDAF